MPMKKRTQKAIQTIQMPMKMPMKMREKTAIQIPLYKQEMTMVQPRWAIKTLISKIARKLTLKASATGMVLTLERCLSEARYSTMMLTRSLLSLLRGMPQSSIQIEAILIAWSIWQLKMWLWSWRKPRKLTKNSYLRPPKCAFLSSESQSIALKSRIFTMISKISRLIFKRSPIWATTCSTPNTESLKIHSSIGIAQTNWISHGKSIIVEQKHFWKL